jgi:tetratricopeptide (TPR) repeat protein
MYWKGFLYAAAIAAALLGSVSTARADAVEEAREHFRKGSNAFDLGHYAEAIKEYEAAYNLKEDPALLFNIAQAYRLQGDDQSAIRVYKSFLRRQPDSPNRVMVERRIAELEKAVEQHGRAKEGPPEGTLPVPERAQPSPPAGTTTPSPAPAPPPPQAAPPPAQPTAASTDLHPGRTKIIAGSSLLGVAVVAIIGGTVAAVLSGQASDSINAAAAAGQAFDPSKESAGQTDTIVSGVMFGVAGAAAVAGAVLTVMGVRERRAHGAGVSFAPMLAPGYAGATAGVRF